MAQPGCGEASMSVLERLLANAALRDEAGRLRGPEPRARLPSGVSQGRWGGSAGNPVPETAAPGFPGPAEVRVESSSGESRQRIFPWEGRAWVPRKGICVLTSPN
jgi:hypothetical protein